MKPNKNPVQCKPELTSISDRYTDCYNPQFPSECPIFSWTVLFSSELILFLCSQCGFLPFSSHRHITAFILLYWHGFSLIESKTTNIYSLPFFYSFHLKRVNIKWSWSLWLCVAAGWERAAEVGNAPRHEQTLAFPWTFPVGLKKSLWTQSSRETGKKNLRGNQISFSTVILGFKPRNSRIGEISCITKSVPLTKPAPALLLELLWWPNSFCLRTRKGQNLKCLIKELLDLGSASQLSHS